PSLNWILDLLPPVSLIMKEIIVVPGIEHRLQEQTDDLQVTHVAEAPVGGVNAPANDPEPAVRNFLAQQIVLCVEGALVETAQAVERSLLEQHEHPSAERPDQHRAILRNVVSDIEHVVAQRAVAAPDVGGHALQLAPHG